LYFDIESSNGLFLKSSFREVIFLYFKIVTWSSLDWFKSDLRTRWELDSIIGVTFDIVVHICMAYYLGQYLDVAEVIVSLSIVHVGVLVLLFGPYYAWASPGKEPAWIDKRIHPERINKKKC
jgi:hypothetical protein